MDSSYLNVTAKSFVPGSNSNDDKPSTKLVFNPFQVVPEEAIDDSILQLSEHLLSSDLLNDDYEEDSQQDSTSPPDEGIVYYSQPVQSNAFFAPFQAQQDAVNDGTSSLDSPLKNIWDAPSTTRQTTAWDSFEPYSSHENENEFDPTLQYYNDGYYDSATIQDIHKLSLQVTNPSAEEEQAENVGEDMSTLQMLQSIFSDLKDEELSATLENYDYDMDRAIESLLKSHTTNDNNNNNNNNASLPILSSTQSNTTSSSSSNTTAVLLGGKKRQVCRHFLAGECYRKDCWFVHDLSEKVCKFWLQGTCFKGDACEFSHVIDFQQVADKIIIPPSTSSLAVQNEAPVDFNQGDYPELIPSSLKTKPVTIKSGPTIAATPTTKEQDFPSLSEAASVRSKSKTSNNNNNSSSNSKKQVVNFAAIASKNKDQPIKKRNKLPAGNNNKSYYASIQKLKKPVQIPWLETGSSLHSVYMKERKLAIEYGMLRNRFFRKAADYYQKGDGTKAKLYSMEAHKYNHLMREMHTEASQRIFEQRSKNEAFIDLHGLHQDEALDIIDDRLSRIRGHYEGVIYIVTGTGHHSGTAGLTKKQSKLKPCVENYLKQEYYRFAETSIVGDSKGGVFAVDLSS